MTPDQAQPRFPLTPAMLAISLGALVLTAAAWVIIPTFFTEDGDLTRTIIGSGLLIGLLGLASLVPAAIAAKKGLHVFAGVWTLGIAVRMIGTLLGARVLAEIGTFVGGQPLAATLASIYLPLLVVEVICVWVYLRSLHALDDVVARTASSAASSAKESAI